MLEATETKAISPAFTLVLHDSCGHTHFGNKTEERDLSRLCEHGVSMKSSLYRDSENESAASAVFEHRLLRFILKSG